MNQKHIVFIQTAFIGDLFLSLPTLSRLRKKYPEHKLILICKKGLSQYFVKEKKVDLAFEVEKNDSLSYKTVLIELKKFEIDIVFCPHRSLRSALFSVKIQAPVRFGFKSWLSFLFFSQSIKHQKKWPEVIRQMNILSLIDAELKSEIEKKDWSYLNKKKSDGSFFEIPEIFSFATPRQSTGDTVAVFPGSVWNTKQWTQEGFSELTMNLIKKNKTVYLMGGLSEKKICQEIQNDNPLAINLAGQLSLYESIQHLKKCHLVICNDSAPSHMAASFGIQVIALFGPTTSALGFRPWQNQSYIVENENIDCRPCGAHGHHRCPKGHHLCMKDIKTNDVLKVIEHNP